MRGEGAVLAVALAGPGEGERVVAGEGDPAHAAQATATADPARPGSKSKKTPHPDRVAPALLRSCPASVGGLVAGRRRPFRDRRPDVLRRFGRRQAARL